MSEACNTCPSKSTCTTGTCPTTELTEAQKASNIKKIIAVMSGKGGVGKSSVTSMLAVSLAKKGYKVGVLDADITGPSIPKMFGVKVRAEANDKGVIPPKSSLGIKIMSLNLLLENEDDPVIWRGSILTQVVKQFWTDVFWGELDYLVVDMPPGTGDVPITVFQSLPVSGVVMVTSPQQIANMVVRKAVKMVRKYEGAFYGLIENMAYIVCPDCMRKIEIFGTPQGQQEAERNEMPFLGELPLDPNLARLADAGRVEDYKSSDFDRLTNLILENENQGNRTK